MGYGNLMRGTASGEKDRIEEGGGMNMCKTVEAPITLVTNQKNINNSY